VGDESDGAVTEAQQRIAAMALKEIEKIVAAYLERRDLNAFIAALTATIRKAIRAAVLAALAAQEDAMPSDLDLTDADEALIEALIEEQREYLGGFATALAEGTVSDKAMAHRAALYTGAILAAYDAARWGDWLLPFRPRDLGTPCKYWCKCSAFVLDQGEGQGLYYYNLGAAEHCDGCVTRSQGSPYVVYRQRISPRRLRIV
jgi:hypothetical protein